MARLLTAIAGPDKGRVFPLAVAGEVLVGRGRQAVVKLADPRVSRIHCQVEIEPDRVLLTDLDSAGGTFVNGRTIDEHFLQAGDIIQVGDTQSAT